MSKLFKRKVQVIIGPLGSTGVLLDGIRVSFSITMDDLRDVNNGDINLYNLAEDTLGYLEKKDSSIILKVGYGDEDPSVLFIGNIVSYYSEKTDSCDTITRITAKDGYVPLIYKQLSLSFPENSTSKQIIDKITADLNLTKGDYSALPNYVYKQGFSFIGSVYLGLSQVLDRIGYDWTVTNNVLVLFKIGETNKNTIGYLLSNETGMLGKPRRLKESNVKKKVKNNESSDGWEINCLIIPQIKPKSVIKVESENVNGYFVVKSIISKGDNDSTQPSSFSSKIKAIPV